MDEEAAALLALDELSSAPAFFNESRNARERPRWHAPQWPATTLAIGRPAERSPHRLVARSSSGAIDWLPASRSRCNTAASSASTASAAARAALESSAADRAGPSASSAAATPRLRRIRRPPTDRSSSSSAVLRSSSMTGDLAHQRLGFTRHEHGLQLLLESSPSSPLWRRPRLQLVDALGGDRLPGLSCRVPAGASSRPASAAAASAADRSGSRGRRCGIRSIAASSSCTASSSSRADIYPPSRRRYGRRLRSSSPWPGRSSVAGAVSARPGRSCTPARRSAPRAAAGLRSRTSRSDIVVPGSTARYDRIGRRRRCSGAPATVSRWIDRHRRRRRTRAQALVTGQVQTDGRRGSGGAGQAIEVRDVGSGPASMNAFQIRAGYVPPCTLLTPSARNSGMFDHRGVALGIADPHRRRSAAA